MGFASNRIGDSLFISAIFFFPYSYFQDFSGFPFLFRDSDYGVFLVHFYFILSTMVVLALKGWFGVQIRAAAFWKPEA
jgi:hypothetical protein